MVRPMAILVGSLTLALTCWPATWATADPSSSQYVRTESGKVRCWVTANNQGTAAAPPSCVRHLDRTPWASYKRP